VRTPTASGGHSRISRVCWFTWWMKTIYSSWQKLIGARSNLCYLAIFQGFQSLRSIRKASLGGVPENDLKGTQGRRATSAGLEDVELHEKAKRPTTAVGVTKQVKLKVKCYWLNSYCRLKGALNCWNSIGVIFLYYNQWQHPVVNWSGNLGVFRAGCIFQETEQKIVGYTNFLLFIEFSTVLIPKLIIITL